MAKKKVAQRSSRSSGHTQETQAADTGELRQLISPTVASIWVDNMQLLTRSDSDTATLRFNTLLPEASYEACRLQTPVAHVRRMIDVMCRTLDYYPERPAHSQSKKPATRKKN